MGCVCVKAFEVGDSKESPRLRPAAAVHAPEKLSAHAVASSSSRRQELEAGRCGVENAAERKKRSRYVRANDQDGELRRERQVHPSHQQMRAIGSIPKAGEGEQIAAGWPAWLAAVAGEAIREWVPRRADSFEKLDKVKCYMQQLLCGLDHCHTRGVLHRDIKGSNLLIDNNGILKIADFGLASFFDPEKHQPLTSRVVTLWYRPPELLLGATSYGVAVDLWSTGCILAELYAGKPIMPGRTEVEQLHKIFKLCGSPSDEYWRKSKLPHATIFKPQQPYLRCMAETYKDFPAPALALIEMLLSVDPADRGTAACALKSEFFTAKPLACHPSTLPRYPPSKELDAKVRDEEARRLGAAGRKVQRMDLKWSGLPESRAVPAPDANAELYVSMKNWQGQCNSKSRSEKFNLHQEETASGFPIEPPRPSPVMEAAEFSDGNVSYISSHSGPLVNRGQWPKARKTEDDAFKLSSTSNLSALSGLVAARRIAFLDGSESNGSQLESTAPAGRMSESINENSDKRYDPLYLGGSHRKKDERGSYVDHSGQECYGPKGNKIHYSGPLLRTSGNVDQMLKDHDLQIREVTRRARMDRSKAKKNQGAGNQSLSIKPYNLGVIPVYPSSRSSVLIFNSSREAMQE